MIIRRPIFLALALAACEESERSNPPQLEDQSGAVFDWVCEDDRCRPRPIDGEPALPDCGPNGLRPSYSYSWGLYIHLSAICADETGSWSTTPAETRLVVCESDADCPLIPRGEEVDVYECNAGFCKQSSLADRFGDLPDRYHMELLCLGHIPRFEPFEGSPELAAAIAAACPSQEPNQPCVALPEGCPDPRG